MSKLTLRGHIIILRLNKKGEKMTKQMTKQNNIAIVALLLLV